MARNTTTKTEDTAPETVSEDAALVAKMKAEDSATEWETVADESPARVNLDEIGDVFIGTYTGILSIPAENNITREHPEGEAFDLYTFKGVDGKPYALGKTNKLDSAMESIQPGAKVRIELMKLIQTKNGLNPMKDFKVSVAKS